MRIISGELKGRNFNAPSGHKTHPMSEKIRGAIFNVLGDIEGLTLLDAFSGTGAIAFEALSRGASKVVTIDSSPESNKVVNQSAGELGLANKIKVIRANVSSWSDNNKDQQFDLVVADPPYDNVQEGILNKLSIHLKTDGIYVLSLPPRTEVGLDELKLVSKKEYGDSVIYFYKKVV